MTFVDRTCIGHRGLFTIALAVLVAATLAPAGSAARRAPTPATIDPPGAVDVPGSPGFAATAPFGINNRGQVVIPNPGGPFIQFGSPGGEQ